MRPTRKNYRQSTHKVKSNFTRRVQKLFTAELHGYKITVSVVEHGQRLKDVEQAQ